MKVAIFEGHWPTLMPEGPTIERQVLGPNIEVKWFGKMDPNDYQSILSTTHAAIIRPGTHFSKGMIGLMKACRVIVSLGVGYDQICLETTEHMGIPVCNVQDYCTDEVADTTIAMLLAHQRKLSLYQHTGQWDWKTHIPIERPTSLNVGIVGLGLIGRAVAKRLLAFGYRISYYDPFVETTTGSLPDLKRNPNLTDLLRGSDIVTIHCPLSKKTDGLIDEKFFSTLKPRAIILNTARGGIFKNSDVLFEALKKYPEFRLGTDAWPKEPPDDSRLLTAWKNRESWLKDRLLIYPHTAFYSENALHDLRANAANIVKTVFTGNKPYNVVNGVTARS